MGLGSRNTDIEALLSPDEKILWQGDSDRQQYITAARLRQHGAILIGMLVFFPLIHFLVQLSLTHTAVVVLVMGAGQIAFQDWKIRSAPFFRRYVVTDRKIMAITTAGFLRHMPRDSKLKYRISRRKSSNKVHFCHPDYTTFTYVCLTAADIAALEKVLELKTRTTATNIASSGSSPKKGIEPPHPAA